MIFWTRGDTGQLTTNFSKPEFTCQCGKCENQQVDADLVMKLEILRNSFPDGIRITSGYRCPEHQAALLGSGNYQTVQYSQHVLGKAADCKPVKEGVIKEFETEAAKLFEAIGVASTWLHLDLRTGKERRWYYK
jgi:uncharacterized protein YcbK (DUF882 family)